MSAPSKDEVKYLAREGRLTKAGQEILRKKFYNEAKEKCSEHFKAFGDCAKESGLMVVINCRKQNRAMGDCMDLNCSEAAFESFLKSHGLPLPAIPEPWYKKYIS
jgi:Cytochrome c oxidase biogenesis protein Cmc1 like